MSDEPRPAADLEELRDQLASLDERPVAEHPDVLEGAHSALAGELDRLVIPRAGGAGRD